MSTNEVRATTRGFSPDPLEQLAVGENDTWARGQHRQNLEFDARQAVTHVTRGQDLYPATDLHRLLQVLLDLPEPVYHHHQLLLGPDGRKLAKSMGAPRLKDLRRAGVTPEEVRQMLGLQTAPRAE